MLRAAVGGVFLQLFVEQLYLLAGNLVNAVVVVSIGRILAHRFKAGNHAARIAQHAHPRIFDRGE